MSNADTVGGWHKFPDEKPPECEIATDYLVFISGNDDGEAWGYMSTATWAQHARHGSWLWFSGMTGEDVRPITHWMRLPGPPEEGDDG